jgi:signal transduction histidine kinase
MRTAPRPGNEESRLQKLRSYDILDTPPEEPFERITRIVAETMGAPIAAVSLIDRDRMWMKSRRGLDIAEMPRDLAFCAHAILSDQVFVVEDATRDLRFSANPLVTGDPALRFYAGAPLRTPDGFNLGTLCVIDRRPRTLAPNHRQLLEDLARLTVDEMELRIALQTAMKEAAEQTKLMMVKDEFVSVVTHELRTPLTSIRGALGMLNAGVLGALPEKATQAVTIAHRNAIILSQLVDDILDMQKLQAGQLAFSFEPVETGPVLTETCEDLRGFATDRQVAIDTAIEASAVITCDPRRLRQALGNLLSNAIKFSPAGATVRARLSRTRDTVRYTISDSGSGIPDDFRPHIFQKFSQAQGASRPKGTGLGLAITKAIVDALDGTIDFESAPKKGTTFHVDLPIRRSLTPCGPTRPGRPQG